ncbi:MAG: ABC transporter permease [Gammaproteobacteria bacterium]|nr:ABC transporter permease [Gammaproteobacteria bacterium]
MQIAPVLSALRRHRLASAIIVAEIALACAILCNAISVVASRLSLMQIPSGLAESELVDFGMFGFSSGGASAEPALNALRQIPGVRGVTVLNSLPFSGSRNQTSISTRPEDIDSGINDVARYMGPPGTLQTLGLHLVAGRDFRPDEYVGLDSSLLPSSAHSVILSHALAHKLFGGHGAVGLSVFIDKRRLTVVGVVARLVQANVTDQASTGYSMLLPVTAAGSGSFPAQYYALRTDPRQRQAVLKQAGAVLKKLDPKLVSFQAKTFSDQRADFFSRDRDLAGLLIGVCVLLLLVTALGIVGLASFWVAQRTRTIGIRRALGATRTDILTYFQTENFLIVGAGVVLGMIAAYGLNLWLMQQFEISRLPWFYLPVGAVALWLLGQLAVLAPALRAAAVPPVVATRTV